MGGMGSGRRWHYNKKDTTEGRRKIDVRNWHKRGLLAANTSFSWQWTSDGKQTSVINVHVSKDRIIFNYHRQNSYGEWDNLQYPVLLNRTPCRFGGERPWFICPAKGCHRRVAILYSGNIYACRHCHQLAYTSQRQTDYDRAARQAEKIRGKLGWDTGIFEMEGDKPKGMHWRTFERLAQRQHAQIVKSLIQADNKFGTSFYQEYIAD